MVAVYLECGDHGKSKVIDICSPVSGKQLMQTLEQTHGINSDHYFLKSQGCLIQLHEIIHNNDVSLEQKLCGGKGGFGSMLRAIGAQIEKTTNREACRDLSGRRLRDINEEKRLKAWIEKQPSRNEEVVQRRKKKLAKLCAEPKYEFKDKSYEEQRSALTERVEDAVEVGFAAASTSAIKRSAEENAKTNLKKKKKTILDLDDDIDSDDLESSDESSDEKESIKKQTTSSSNQAVSTKSESENSSDGISHSASSSNEEEKSGNSSSNNEQVASSSNEEENSKLGNSSSSNEQVASSSNEEEKSKSGNSSPKSEASR